MEVVLEMDELAEEVLLAGIMDTYKLGMTHCN
jgi:hypothetical protein